eukprot:scaffold107981_cov13-Tisochrysis_lutea.AAC.1
MSHYTSFSWALVGLQVTSCYSGHTLDQFKLLGLDHQCTIELAHKLQARSVEYANKLLTARRDIERKKRKKTT